MNEIENNFSYELRALERERKILRRGSLALSDLLFDLRALERADLVQVVGAAHRALGASTVRIDRRLAEIHAIKKAKRRVAKPESERARTEETQT